MAKFSKVWHWGHQYGNQQNIKQKIETIDQFKINFFSYTAYIMSANWTK